MEPRLELIAWTLFSLVCGVILSPAALRGAAGRNPLMRELLRFGWMVLIPFAALVRGASAPDAMGLGRAISHTENWAGFTTAEWAQGGINTLAVCAGVLMALWLAGTSAPASAWLGVGPRAFRDALYNEIHWAFYRAAPMLWLNDALPGVVIGIGLCALEWLAHPGFRRMQKTPEGRQRQTIMFACALTSALLYLAIRNVWLMVFANLLIQLAGSRALIRAQSPRRAASAPVIQNAEHEGG